MKNYSQLATQPPYNKLEPVAKQRASTITMGSFEGSKADIPRSDQSVHHHSFDFDPQFGSAVSVSSVKEGRLLKRVDAEPPPACPPVTASWFCVQELAHQTACRFVGGV